MPTHYLTPIPPSPKEFVEPTPDPSFIYWLFRYRCVECKKSACEINEIIPRSRSKSAIMIWTNRIPLCRECHDKFHRTGVTKEKIEKLQKARIDFLRAFGRSEYINYANPFETTKD